MHIDSYVPVCVQLSKFVEAFDFAERSKSKAFIDLLTMSNIKPSLSREKKHKAKYPEKLLVDGKTLQPDKIQKLLRGVSSVVLVEYFLTRDKVFIFVLDKDELHVQTVNLSEKEIIQYLNNYQDEVMDYPNFRKFSKPATNKWLELSEYLINPISDYLTNSKMVYFVPYGNLHYLPLHALLLNKEPLIKSHPVAYSSSSSLLQFYRNKGTHSLKSCAVFGVGFSDEAKEIAKIYNVKPELDATMSKVLNNLNYDILHFSCHGSFNNKDPFSSGIELRDGNLTARQIFDLKLKCELVTLSACETGISENKPGDELIGLTRAFIYAGAPSLVVSLWNVSAFTTKELMEDFYINLKNGNQKVIALQKAQVKIMERYKLQFFWAPFILIGNWK